MVTHTRTHVSSSRRARKLEAWKLACRRPSWKMLTARLPRRPLPHLLQRIGSHFSFPWGKLFVVTRCVPNSEPRVCSAIRRDVSVGVCCLGHSVGEPLNFHRWKSRYCFRLRYIRNHKFKIDAGCWGHFQTLCSIWLMSQPCCRSFAAWISLPSFNQIISNYTSTFKCYVYLL